MTINNLLLFSKGLACLSDSDCCSGFICSNDNGQQEGFCSTTEQTRGLQAALKGLESGNETGIEELRQLVRVFLYIPQV